MVTDSTLRRKINSAYSLGYNSGIKLQSEHDVKEITDFFSKLQLLCTKHGECGDIISFCRRTNGVPCIFRKGIK